MTECAYRQCLESMFRLRRFGIKLEMETIQYILTRLGDPHKQYRCIHIAGTNGKGSVAATLSTLLRQGGYQVGRYTSPHLQRFNERITINDTPISDAAVVETFQEIIKINPPSRQPTFFEFSTAMAFLEFQRKKIDWAVVETGMGGRMDATNILTPKISIITNISLEHKAYLGTTIEAIAKEKAGIIKANTPVITGVRQQSAWHVIKNKAEFLHAPAYRQGRHFRVRRHRDKQISYYGLRHHWKALDISLDGDHQVGNTALALAALENLINSGQIKMTENDIKAGLVQTRWPGRLEIVGNTPLLILDGAHNLMAARLLANHLKKKYTGRHITLVIGILDDKPYRRILKDLSTPCNRIIVTRPLIERALPVSTLETEAARYCDHVEIIPSVENAILHALQTSRKEDVICVAGSLYVVGEAKTALENIKARHLFPTFFHNA